MKWIVSFVNTRLGLSRTHYWAKVGLPDQAQVTRKKADAMRFRDVARAREKAEELMRDFKGTTTEVIPVED